MSIEMTPEEVGRFLDDWRMIGVATLRKDGSPFLQPLGHNLHGQPVHEGDDLYLSIGKGRTIIPRLRRDPRVAISAFNQSFPTMAVIIEGRAEEVEDPGNERSLEILHWNMRDVDVVDIEEFEKNWLGEGRVVFRVKIQRVISWDSHKKEDYNAQAGYTIAEERRSRSGTS